jgi:quercetin dioxygenase-like cupin family protein
LSLPFVKGRLAVGTEPAARRRPSLLWRNVGRSGVTYVLVMTQPHRDRPLGETSGSGQRPARRLAASSLDFDMDTELGSLKQESSWQRGDRNARTLVEEPGLRVTLTALKAGTLVREHRADGWVSIQTTHGHLRVHLPQREVDLPAGHLLVLDRGVRHDVEALDQESAFLLTVATPDHAATS